MLIEIFDPMTLQMAANIAADVIFVLRQVLFLRVYNALLLLTLGILILPVRMDYKHFR